MRKQISIRYRTKLLLNAFKYSKIEALGLVTIKALEYLAFRAGMFLGSFDRKIQRIMTNVEEEFERVGGALYEVRMYRGSIGNKFVDSLEKEITLKIIKEIFGDQKLKVLDVGAGTGRWVREFLNLGYNVTALDISKSMCAYLRRNFSNVNVIHSSIETANLSERYDLIFSFRSFKYIIDRDRALENIYTLLKEGGYTIIEMPNKYNIFYAIPNAIAPVLYSITKGRFGKYFILADLVSEGEFRKSLEKHGFKVKRVEKIFSIPHALYSKVDHEKCLKLLYSLDGILSKISPRSLLFLARKEACRENSVEKDPKRNKAELSSMKPAFIKHSREFLKDPYLTLGFIIYQVVRYLPAEFVF